MILITGASGKTGRTVLKMLVKKGEAVRAFVHRPDQVEPLKKLGAIEVICGNLRSDADVQAAAQGAQKVYHICPNVQPDEIEIGQRAIRAARAAGVSHFVYHSVLHPQAEEMPHHWKKMRVEELLLKSGVDYTILQPAAYMQNILAQWDAILKAGVYSVPYAASTRLGMVDLEDVAEAAALVLTQSNHAGAIYELAGREMLTQSEVCETFGRVLRKPVQIEVTPLDMWERRARSSGMPEYAVSTLLQMFRYYESYGFGGNANVMAGLLGREPTRFEDFVLRVVNERR